MLYGDRDCDLYTLAADTDLELEKLIEKKAAGREVVYVKKTQVSSKLDNKTRLLAQAYIARG